MIDYLRAETFDEFWTVFNALASTIGILFIVFQLVYLTLQFRRAQDQINVVQASETSKIFFEVMDRWTNIYPARNQILSRPPIHSDALLEKYGTNAAELLKTPEWEEEIRLVLNFFEFLGVLLSNDVFDKEAIESRIFTLVTVDNFPRDEEENAEHVKEAGVMYQRLKPYLHYLRHQSEYRSDIYKYYDEHLLPKYVDHVLANRTAEQQK